MADKVIKTVFIDSRNGYETKVTTYRIPGKAHGVKYDNSDGSTRRPDSNPA